MNGILEKKYKSIKFCVLLLVIFCSNFSYAQPGWEDFTTRYFYTILNENGKEVSFKNSKNYSIMIDNMLYKMPNIPQDSLKSPIKNRRDFENQICINDFSLAIPQKNSHESHKRLEIRIIHRKDTMFICQSSGIGHLLGSNSDFTLRFKAGHYYFTNWMGVSTQLPETIGDVRILNAENLNRDYFIIPRNIYESILINTDIRESKKTADEFIATNFFAKGSFRVEKRIELTKFDPLIIQSSWFSNITSTRDSNIYLGLIRDMSGDNFFYERTTFAILNKKENTIKLFLPVEDTRLFYCEGFFVNNSTIYLPCRIRQENNLAYHQRKLPSERHIYISKDDGNTWQEQKTVSDIFEKHKIDKAYNLTQHNYSNNSRIEFIDEDYAVIYSKKLSEHHLKKGKIKEQGVYYLLKNMQVIDSLKSPKDALYYHFNSQLLIQHDSLINLGKWSYDYDKNYSQMFLIKTKNEWKFQVEKKTDLYENHNKTLPRKDSVKEYRNFLLINNNELVFKNGSGKMKLRADLPNDKIIENGKYIYLINNYNCIYISFDAGTTWYLYPFPLLEGSYPQLLEINEQNEISYITNGMYGGDEYKVRKVIYKFSPE
jgi:hypothetical protein